MLPGYCACCSDPAQIVCKHATASHGSVLQARVNVPDDRYLWLLDLYKPKSQVSAFLEVVDIAGLVKCALKSCRALASALVRSLSLVVTLSEIQSPFCSPELFEVEVQKRLLLLP